MLTPMMAVTYGRSDGRTMRVDHSIRTLRVRLAVLPASREAVGGQELATLTLRRCTHEDRKHCGRY